MANLIRRNHRYEVTPFGVAWDPFHVVREALGWEALREADAAAGAPERRTFSLRFDVKETKDAYVFRADLPGVKQENIEISLTGNLLSVSGHREEERHEQSDTSYASERSYGSFSRSFTLPEGVDGDNVTADLKEGVLALTVPKKPEVQPKRITIGKAPEGQAKA
jgi:HSP20 family protein